MDDLVEKVAREICASPNDPEILAMAERCIAVVRAYDIERTQLAIDAYMAGYDPDDYTHPLSLTVGPRHEKGGIQG